MLGNGVKVVAFLKFMKLKALGFGCVELLKSTLLQSSQCVKILSLSLMTGLEFYPYEKRTRSGSVCNNPRKATQ